MIFYIYFKINSNRWLYRFVMLNVSIANVEHPGKIHDLRPQLAVWIRWASLLDSSTSFHSVSEWRKSLHLFFSSFLIYTLQSFISTFAMGLLRLLRDMIMYPRDPNKEANRFHEVLTFLLRDYPAFLWTKPSIIRVVVFPLFLLYFMFKE